ncbi:hypothetical protein [Stenotrophomonas sp.]|uniref:hypothetical protein n=1 Tax=Stenotrophomonas sp. TaxID=69392 RepID=UPI002FC915A6
MPVVLVAALSAACVGNHAPPPGTALQDVRAIEIHYRYSGWDRVDEVHRLQPGPGRRTFVRRSQGEAHADSAADTGSVPAQRVGELLWAMSAPAWSPERAVAHVARRVRPAQLLKQALPEAGSDASACSGARLQGYLQPLLRGAELRGELLQYYQGLPWTDDDPVMEVRIEYDHAPPQRLASRSQRLQMLPWTLGGPAPAPATTSYAVPVTQAVRRLLPPTSRAAARLEAREDGDLAGRIVRRAREACAAQTR